MRSCAPVDIPIAQALLALSPYIAAAHLLVGYAALGGVPFLRPELTGARD